MTNTIKIDKKEKIIRILNTVIDEPNIYLDDDKDLLSVGLDSILFIRMAILLEEEFEIKIPDSYLFFEDMNTINKVLRVIEIVEKKAG